MEIVAAAPAAGAAAVVPVESPVLLPHPSRQLLARMTPLLMVSYLTRCCLAPHDPQRSQLMPPLTSFQASGCCSGCCLAPHEAQQSQLPRRLLRLCCQDSLRPMLQQSGWVQLQCERLHHPARSACGCCPPHGLQCWGTSWVQVVPQAKRLPWSLQWQLLLLRCPEMLPQMWTPALQSGWRFACQRGVKQLAERQGERLRTRTWTSQEPCRP
mmetsp:Transcript_8114/g.24113  ORF Transcript_8114/g.24113 Transcript_8114/m.24113 type:complete len:212 (+) Transcript_8114:1894-2529(+)